MFGPKLSCASTGKINHGLELNETIYPSVSIKAVTFVDDINGSGSRRFVQAVIGNCNVKEDQKLWEFSILISLTGCVSRTERKMYQQ